MDTNNTNKNVFELAITLGKALKEDERLVRMEAARKAYEEDPTLRQLTTEYDVQQRAIQKVASTEDFDPQLMESIQNRINELYDQIMAAPAYVELMAAQEAVNELMNAVNNTITFAITGEMPSNCTHDCSTCGGCH
ncbi:MAG: YlbF family regulator [Ruminococcaceae bacterium]|nr:YlbF family regulator [Oscillospiraceae bacterium]